eukprot:scaffold47_cov258-Pinguiococcus_pyrenoidosus.AAC.37
MRKHDADDVSGQHLPLHTDPRWSAPAMRGLVKTTRPLTCHQSWLHEGVQARPEKKVVHGPHAFELNATDIHLDTGCSPGLRCLGTIPAYYGATRFRLYQCRRFFSGRNRSLGWCDTRGCSMRSYSRLVGPRRDVFEANQAWGLLGVS